MRFKKSLINLLASWSGQAVLIVVNLIARRVFVDMLGEEYLGISGLFSNILSVLSLAELGIGTAISFSLYKPLAENDIVEIKSIMSFYKMVYRFVFGVVLCLGILLIPFLNDIVPEIQSYENVYIYYMLFVINTAISYLYSYKSTLINANQKRYVYIINHYVWVSLLGIVQIISLLFTHNYILYLVLQTSFTFFENFSVSRIANKMYPYLKEKDKTTIRQEVINEIKKNTFAMLLDKVGGVLVTATDNILMSRYLSLAITGLYSSYAYVINSIGMIFMQLFSAIQASIGNFGVEEEIDARERVYKSALFVGFLFYSFGAICLFFLLTPFVSVWIGNKYILSSSTVLLIVIIFYVNGMRQVSLTFISGLGLFWDIKWKAILEGVTNFIISLVCVKEIGINGIFIGTLVSAILVGWFYEPYVVYKKGLKKPYSNFCKLNFQYIISVVGIGGVIYGVKSLIGFQMEGIKGLIVLFLICLIIYAMCIWILWHNNQELISLINRLKMINTRILKKET